LNYAIVSPKLLVVV